MKVVVVGCGHVGLVTAVSLAALGHEVAGVDSDPDRVATLRSGRPPFHEPGLDDLLAAHAGRTIRFYGDAGEALVGADVAFICVNTPPRPEGRLNLAYVERAARTIAEHASGSLVVVEKSTCPVQTARRIINVLGEAGRFPEIEVVCNPEFLREGHAVHDALEPDRIVIGLAGPGRAEEVMRRLYAPIVDRTGCPVIVTDLETAETIKHACNSYLAMRISYVNAVASLCERVGADVDTVTQAMGLDPRIGPHHLRAGVGYGGSCFPKDVAAFIAQARDAGVDFGLIEEVRRVNARQRETLLEKVHKAMWTIDGKLVAVWGLAFKAGTDDMRDAPSLDVVPALIAEGARVRAYDPAASTEAKTRLPDIELATDPLSAAHGADALVVLTEWPEFESVDLTALKDTLGRPVVVDGRNIWPVERMARAGFTYLSFGRPDVVLGEVRQR